MKAPALKATGVSLLITVILAVSMVILPASALAAYTWADLGTTGYAINAILHVPENNTLYAACSDFNVYSKALPAGSWTTGGPGTSEVMCLAYDRANARIFAGMISFSCTYRPCRL